MTSVSRLVSLHGTFVWSHGDAEGFGGRALFGGHGKYFYTSYKAITASLQYKLGIVILNICEAGWKKGERGPKGNILSGGGRDWVSGTTGQKWFGRKGVLFPVGLFNPLQLKWATVTHFKHVDSLLKPGEQGTRK